MFWVCLNSPSKRLVITAGHCVHGGGKNGAWHKNWVFIPDYHYDHRPFGTFQAKTLTTFQGWIDNGEGRRGFERDVAFVTTYTNASGQKVVDAVGGYGLRTGDREILMSPCLDILETLMRARECGLAGEELQRTGGGRAASLRLRDAILEADLPEALG